MIGDPVSSVLEPTVRPAPDPRQMDATMGKEEFLKLLVAQLKNQDPLSPTNPEEMASQLAQFSSLEQLINVNALLTEQTASNTAMALALNNSAAVSVLGFEHDDHVIRRWNQSSDLVEVKQA